MFPNPAICHYRIGKRCIFVSGIQSMGILQSIIVAVSLCADCFAVSLCSSVTIRKISWGQVLKVSFAFAVIQSGLLLAGWLFGNIFVGWLSKVSHIIGFLLLLYVGGSMLLEGIKGESEVRDLNGLWKVVIAGVATSIDALAVGVAQSMAGQSWGGFLPLLLSLFAVTALSVIIGIWGGKSIGCRFGRWAEIAGGVVLTIIGILLLF